MNCSDSDNGNNNGRSRFLLCFCYRLEICRLVHAQREGLTAGSTLGMGDAGRRLGRREGRGVRGRAFVLQFNVLSAFEGRRKGLWDKDPSPFEHFVIKEGLRLRGDGGPGAGEKPTPSEGVGL